MSKTRIVQFAPSIRFMMSYTIAYALSMHS